MAHTDDRGNRGSSSGSISGPPSELREGKEAVGELAFRALSGGDADELLEQAARTVARVLRVEYCEVLELLPEGDGMLLRAGFGWREGYVGEAVVGVGLDSQAGYTLLSREPVVSEDLDNEVRFRAPALLSEHGAKSGVTTTIYLDGLPWGVLGAHTTGRRAFGEDEVSFLQEVATVIGAALERFRTDREIEEQDARARASQRRFEFLAEANLRLSSLTEHKAVLVTAVNLVVPNLASWCFLDLVEEQRGRIHRLALAYSGDLEGEAARRLEFDYPFSAGVSHGTLEVFRSGRPELIPEVNDELLRDIARSREHLEILRRLKPVSYLCVPLRVRGRILGALGMVSADPKHRYGREDLLLAEGVAHITALALENIRLHLSEYDLVRELIERARRESLVISTADSRKIPELTPRQLEVLGLLAEGKSAREIGAELHLSQATVRNHIRSLLQALGAHSQLEALAIARRAGIISG